MGSGAARVVIATMALLASCVGLRGGPNDAQDAGANGDAGPSTNDGEPAADSNIASGDYSSFEIVRRGTDGFNTMFGFASNDIYAGGENGLMLHFTGSEWETITLAAGAEITSIWGTQPDDIYAVGIYKGNGRGIILHYQGHGWTEELEVEHGLLFVRGVGDSIFAGGLQGFLYKKTPTKDWYQLIQLEQSPYVEKLPNSPVLYSLAANGTDKMLVAADLNLVYYFIGAGRWVPTYDPIDRTRAFRSAWASPSTDWNVYVGANYLGVWLSAGKDQPIVALHEEKDTPERQQQTIWGIWGTSSDRVMFVGDDGRMMTFDGAAPRNLPSPTHDQLAAIWGSSWDDVWIGGAKGMLLHGHVKF